MGARKKPVGKKHVETLGRAHDRARCACLSLSLRSGAFMIDKRLVAWRGKQGIDFFRIEAFDLEHPALVVAVFVDDLRACIKHFVDLYHFSGDRCAYVTGCFDGFHDSAIFVLFQNVPQFGELNKGYLTHGLLGMIGDADDGKVVFDLNPLVCARIFAIFRSHDIFSFATLGVRAVSSLLVMFLLQNIQLHSNLLFLPEHLAGDAVLVKKHYGLIAFYFLGVMSSESDLLAPFGFANIARL